MPHHFSQHRKTHTKHALQQIFYYTSLFWFASHMTKCKNFTGFACVWPLSLSFSVSCSLAGSQINRPPAKLNLLTCQVRPNPEEKRTFDLVTRKLIFDPFFQFHDVKDVFRMEDKLTLNIRHYTNILSFCRRFHWMHTPGPKFGLASG